MKRYKLACVMYGLRDSTGDDKVMAEIPAVPGRRVWGNTPVKTLHILGGLAEAFTQPCEERGLELPTALVEAPVQTGEVTVTAWPTGNLRASYADSTAGLNGKGVATTRLGYTWTMMRQTQNPTGAAPA